MKKIDTILQFLNKTGIKTATFEREIGAGNGYLDKTVERGSDVTYKFIEKLREKKPEWYMEIFGTIEKAPYDPGLSSRDAKYIGAIAYIRVLSDAVAKIQAEVFGRNVLECHRELERQAILLADRMRTEDV